MVQAKIYRLVDNTSGKTFYIGVTMRTLKQRLTEHYAMRLNNSPMGVRIREANNNISIVLIRQTAAPKKFIIEYKTIREYLKKNEPLINIPPMIMKNGNLRRFTNRLSEQKYLK